jgi:hypothetical protein
MSKKIKKEKNALSKLEVKEQLDIVMKWVTDQIKKQDVPRSTDVLDYTYRVLRFKKLGKNVILKRLRLHPAYLMTSTQARQRLRSGKHRPILVNSLGNLHGDIGFYAITKEYETPVNFRTGFLVCKDVLSRYTMVSVLKKTRTAESMMKGFKEIFGKFRKHYDGMLVKSLAFDQERSVMSHKVQSYLKEKFIKFHPFANTSSKSKMAENAIKQIRTTVARLKGHTENKEIRWWRLIDAAVETLNKQPIKINGKYLSLPYNTDHPYYTPNDVNASNLKDYISKIQKAAPDYYWAQFSIAPQTVKFKYEVGTFVRPKLIVISSEVIGTKRSEVTLSNDVFIIEKQIPFVSAAHTIENDYYCKNIATGKIEKFAENDIAETVGPFSKHG